MPQGFYERICAFMQAQSAARTVAGKTILLRAGETENRLYYIAGGAVQLVAEDGEKPQVIRLGYRHSLINALPSFLSEKPSMLSLQTLRKTTFYALHRTALLDGFLKQPNGMHDYNSLLVEMLMQQHEREIDLLEPDPESRYQRVLARSPRLFEEVPLRYIASYLRMTPETLSRIRKC